MPTSSQAMILLGCSGGSFVPGRYQRSLSSIHLLGSGNGTSTPGFYQSPSSTINRTFTSFKMDNRWMEGSPEGHPHISYGEIKPDYSEYRPEMLKSPVSLPRHTAGTETVNNGLGQSTPRPSTSPGSVPRVRELRHQMTHRYNPWLASKSEQDSLTCVGKSLSTTTIGNRKHFRPYNVMPPIYRMQAVEAQDRGTRMNTFYDSKEYDIEIPSNGGAYNETDITRSLSRGKHVSFDTLSSQYRPYTNMFDKTTQNSSASTPTGLGDKENHDPSTGSKVSPDILAELYANFGKEMTVDDKSSMRFQAFMKSIQQTKSHGSTQPMRPLSAPYIHDRSDTTENSEASGKTSLKGKKKLKLPVMRMRKELPAPQPLRVCFSCHGYYASHEQIKQLIECQVPSRVTTLQFDPRSIHVGKPASKSLWVVSLSDLESRDTLVKKGIKIDGSHVVIRAYDDVMREEYEAYLMFRRIEEEKRQKGLKTSLEKEAKAASHKKKPLKKKV